MSIRILADSCCDLTPALKTLLGVQRVPLELRPGPDQNFIDDETLDTGALLRAMKASKQATSTACPSPEAYAAAMRECDACIVVTLSAKLSGSYNAAVMGRNLVLEETPDKQIFVLDSESAAAEKPGWHFCSSISSEKGCRLKRLSLAPALSGTKCAPSSCWKISLI